MAETEHRVAAKELRDRNESELRSLLNAKVEELHGLRFKHALGQLRETHNIGSLRRDIARINTVLRQSKAAEVQS